MPASLLPNPLERPAQVNVPHRAPWQWLPLCLAVVLYLAASAGPALFDQNEAQYASAAREMINRPADYLPATRTALERGHLAVPTNDGIPRLEKPPMVYWTLLVSMSVFGISEFGARLPNALASLLWFAGIYSIGRRAGGERLGRWGATILATMAGTFILCHLIAPEPFLAAALTWTFWCFLQAVAAPPATARRWMTLAWVCMALGTACKGLHGALYPLVVAALLAWRVPYTRQTWKLLWRPLGPLLFLAIVVPWFIVVEARYPGFLKDQLFNEQLGHVFNKRYPSDSTTVPFLVFWLEQLIFFLPWTFFIPAALAARPASRTATNELARNLLLAWFGVTAVSIVFSSMQDYYLLSAWGPVALWIAAAWEDADGRSLPLWTRISPGFLLAAGGLAALSTAIWLRNHSGMQEPVGPTAIRDTMLQTINGISLASWHHLLPLIWGTGFACLFGGITILQLALRGNWRWVPMVTAIATLIVLALAGRGLVEMENQFSLKALALVANADTQPDTIVACAGTLSDNPSILFYTNREIAWVGVPPNAEFATRQLGIGQSLYLTDEKFLTDWRDPARAVYLIVEQDDFPQWDAQLAPIGHGPRQEWRSGTRIMLCNGGGHPR